MISPGFSGKRLLCLRRIILLLLVARLAPETLSAQTDTLTVPAIQEQTAPVERTGVNGLIPIGVGTIGGGLGAIIGVCTGPMLIGRSMDGLSSVYLSMFVGYVAGSALVVHHICIRNGVNSSYALTLLGSTLGLVAAVLNWDRDRYPGEEVISFLLPASTATLFAHLRGYKDDSRAGAPLPPPVELNIEKDYLDQSRLRVTFRLVSISF